MMSLACAIEPLRSANRLAEKPLYAWRLARLDDDLVPASNGIPFEALNLNAALHNAAMLFVCGGMRIKPSDERRYLGALRGALRLGIDIGALSTGSYLLARAGLLRGYRCTIHWENRQAFREEFPDIDCTDKIYEIDRNRLTCAGGTAAMDLMLRIVGDEHGLDLAKDIANQFQHDRIRDADEEQRGGLCDRHDRLPSSVRNAMRAMEAAIENPIDMDGLTQRIGIGKRQIERLFVRYTGLSPVRYYIKLRLERANELLLYSDQTVLDVAVATGFSSTSHFSYWFKQEYKVRPSEAREKAFVRRGTGCERRRRSGIV